MTQLTNLRKLNRTYARFNAALGLLAAVGTLWMMVDLSGVDPLLDRVMLGSSLLIVVLVAAFVVLLEMTGSRVAQGRWRVVQTVLAVINVSSNPPVGTAYALYALWVCWSHPASRARFEGGAPPEPDPEADARGDRYFRIARGLIVWFGVAFAVLTAAAFVGMHVVMDWGGRPMEVAVTGEAVTLTGMYGEEIDLDDVTRVELRQELPTITARTNGYALGPDLKGWFATREYGRVKLFVDADTPPFIYIFRGEGLVILGTTDPEETEGIYAQMARDRGEDPAVR